MDSYINPDEYVSVNNVLKEYDELKDYVQYIKIIETQCVSCKENTVNRNTEN